MSQRAGQAVDTRSAREARSILSQATSALTGSESAKAALSRLHDAIESLQRFEAEPAVAVRTHELKRAVKALSEALALLQTDSADAALDTTIEVVARSLALLYPLARSAQRKKKDAVLELVPAVDAPAEPAPDSLPFSAPPAPEPTGSRPAARAFSGENKRAQGERVFVEVDIGLISESHFYTGLSRDISRGGVFVATYQPQPPGTRMTLFFVLPSGREVQASGIVRWTSDAVGDVAPGMGVAFENVSDADAEAILEFCESRQPLYHDSADD